jgi:hypothetical protein
MVTDGEIIVAWPGAGGRENAAQGGKPGQRHFAKKPVNAVTK